MKHAVTTAEVLKGGGYFTAMTGKWHLQQETTDFGFDRYFGHLSGACNCFTGDNTFRLNDKPWTVPPKYFYTTVANVDFAQRFLTKQTKPNSLRYFTSLSTRLMHHCKRCQRTMPSMPPGTMSNMAKEVLHAPARVTAPAGPAKLPHARPEWTDFSSDPTPPSSGSVNESTSGPSDPALASQRSSLTTDWLLKMLKF